MVPELMDRFGLPRTLLPETARRYLLHANDSFKLFLDDGCVVETTRQRWAHQEVIPGRRVQVLAPVYHWHGRGGGRRCLAPFRLIARW
jgi:hypothetical protein